MKRKIRIFVCAALLCAIAAAATGCTLGEPAVSAAAQQAAEPSAEAVVAFVQQTAQPAEDVGAEQAQTQPDAPADAAVSYAAILAQYAEAEKNGFYASLPAEQRDAAFGADVALEWRANPQPVSYALADLDGNGTAELVVAVCAEGSEPILYDVWSIANGSPARVFDMDLGYRAALSILADGTLKVQWSNSAFESGVDLYRLDGAAASLLHSFVIRSDADDPNTMRYEMDGAALPEADFDAQQAALEAPGAWAFDWMRPGAAS